MASGDIHFAPPRVGIDRRTVRLVAGLAGNAAGVIRRIDLGKALGLGRAGRVAADAEHGRVQLGRRYARGIVGVLGQRSVTGFAVHVRVLAGLLYVQNVGVAGLAGLVAGELDRARCDLGDGGAAVVSVLSEARGTTKSRTTRKRRKARTKSPANRKRCPASLNTFIQPNLLDAEDTRRRLATSCDPDQLQDKITQPNYTTVCEKNHIPM